MHGGQSFFLASLPHSPSPFLHSLQTFRSNMDAPSLTVASVRKKYDCFAVYLPLTTAFLQVSHDAIPFSCLQIGLSSFVPDVANVLLCVSLCLLDHPDLPEFGLNFPPSYLGVYIVFGQPEAISLTWTSVSSHLSKSTRSTSLGCNSNFRLLHRSAITGGNLLITSCMLAAAFRSAL